MTDKGSGGSGYQVEVDSLRAFAGQVRGLLAEFQASADGKTAHAKSGVGKGSFGEFTEATTLHDQYDVMRDGLRDALIALHQLIDDAQAKADLTATNYDEREQDTARSLRVTSDGWSVGSPATAAYVASGAGGVVTGAAAGRSAAARGTPVDGLPVDGTSGTDAVPPVTGTPTGTGKGKSKRGKPDQTGSTAPDGTELPSW